MTETVWHPLPPIGGGFQFVADEVNARERDGWEVRQVIKIGDYVVVVYFKPETAYTRSLSDQ